MCNRDGCCRADVVINYFQSEDSATELVEQIRGYGQRATAVQADAFTQEGVDTLFTAANQFFDSGRTDVLVCTAGGLNVRGELLELDTQTIADSFQMNYMSS